MKLKSKKRKHSKRDNSEERDAKKIPKSPKKLKSSKCSTSGVWNVVEAKTVTINKEPGQIVSAENSDDVEVPEKRRKESKVELSLHSEELEKHETETLNKARDNSVRERDRPKSNSNKKTKKWDSSLRQESKQELEKHETESLNKAKNDSVRERDRPKSNSNRKAKKGDSSLRQESKQEEDLSETPILSVPEGNEDYPELITSQLQEEGSQPSYKVFKLDNDRQEVLMLLQREQQVPIWGRFALKVLRGTVDVCGYTVPEGTSKVFPVFSPNSSAFLSISTKPSEAPSELALSILLEELRPRMTTADINSLKQRLKGDRTLITLSLLNSTLCNFISQFHPFNRLFPKIYEKPHGFDEGSLDGLGIRVRDTEDAVYISQEMQEAKDHILSCFSDGVYPRVAICGGKNVGKSSLARYLINSLLSRCDRVAYLDCDLGQTEFTPPACVSLCIVNEPLLGPPFSHLKKPLKSCFFGEVSPANNPEHYLHCLNFVFEAYRELDPKLPLIINTMGWNQGLGLMFLADTLKMCQANTVLQINSSISNRNLPPVDVDFVANTNSIFPKAQQDQEKTKKFHKLIILDSVVELEKDFVNRISPKDHRNLAVLSCLSQMYKEYQKDLPPLHALQPHTVAWSSVGVHVCHTEVPNSQILASLNASFVALCNASDDYMESSEDDTLPRFFNKKPICDILGFGVLRSIDPEKKCFYILSPLSAEEMEGVNCLLRGIVEIPHQVLLQQIGITREAAYLGVSKVASTGSKPPEKKRYLPRSRPSKN